MRQKGVNIMLISADRSGTIGGFEGLTKEVLSAGAEGLLILAADQNGFTPEIADPVLRRIPVPVTGGTFPAIIHGGAKLEKGTVVVGTSRPMTVRRVAGLSDPATEYEQLLEEEIPDVGDARTMMVLVDGFSQRIGAFIDGLFNMFGPEVNYIGGGAGSLSMEQKPCLFTNQGMAVDSAVIALLDSESSVGVCHGWESISGPHKVTESDRNVVKTLDWKPAFDVYREIVEKHSGKDFTEDNFFDIAKSYPFGIAKMGTERVVRDPLMLGENGSMICVGEVPEGSFIDVMNGDAKSLLAAAGRAHDLSHESITGNTELSIFMDCISRVLFLGERFEEEINAVYDDKSPLVGACTIGEIANSGGNYLEFYNKTSVVANLVTI